MSRDSGSGVRNNKASCNSITLQIDELVLHGFSPIDRHHVGDALQEELGRRLSERSIAATLRKDGEYSEIDAASIRIGANSNARSIGRNIARSVYEALQRSKALGSDEGNMNP
ncbi:MAG: hypothetical protein JXA73_18125 [Acidobacteria bacterium]|nr:hypothetical protein [Acidobacteriota bacterium]